MSWDWEAIRAGGLVALVFAVPFSIAARWAADSRDDSTLAVWLNIGAVLGFVVGAGCAAWVQRTDTPLSHGLVTAAGTYLAAQAVFVVLRLVRGLDVRWFAVMFNLTVALAAGLIGGLLGQHLQNRGIEPAEPVSPPAQASWHDATVTGILVIDVGTSTLRAAVVDENLQIVALAARSSPPASPFPGLVEFDAADVARRAVDAATEATTAAGRPITAVGITNQRASTIVWDRDTGEPIGPALGWQDLRTIMECITAKEAHGLHLAPNQSATKVAWLLDNVAGARDRDLCFGTLDSWLAWTLSGGALHVTDHTNAAVTGLLAPDASAWSDRALDALGIPATLMPTLADSTGVIGEATVLPGAPPIAIAGRRPAGIVGRPGMRQPGAGQDHVRHRRDARPLPRSRRRRRRPSEVPTARIRSWRGRRPAR